MGAMRGYASRELEVWGSGVAVRRVRPETTVCAIRKLMGCIAQTPERGYAILPMIFISMFQANACSVFEVSDSDTVSTNGRADARKAGIVRDIPEQS